MNKPFDTYSGGKGGSGCYQQIINQIPPHKTYIETHLGNGTIYRKKRKAEINIGIDINNNVIQSWQKLNDEDLQLHTADCISFLEDISLDSDCFIYVDPPYLHSTRNDLNLYEYEMTDQQHISLLSFLEKQECMIMISGYWSELYADLLSEWRFKQFRVMTRQGVKTETIWMNYPEPTKLHDYSYLGDDFRERERIKKLITRKVSSIKSLPPLERSAILNQLERLQ